MTKKKGRGLVLGVELVIRDDHERLRKTIEEMLPSHNFIIVCCITLRKICLFLATEIPEKKLIKNIFSLCALCGLIAISYAVYYKQRFLKKNFKAGNLVYNRY